MADAKFEEVLRLAFEATGADGITKVAQIMANLGDVSEETRAEAAAVLDAVSATEKTTRAVKAFRDVGNSVLDYKQKIDKATTKVQTLAAAIDASDAPTKKQTKELDKARVNLKGLVAEQGTQVAKLKEVKAQLDASGISLTSFSIAERELKLRTDAAGDSLREMATRLRDQSTAQNKATADLARQEFQWRKVAKAVEDAGDAERRNATVAEQSSHRATEGLERTRESAGRLREVLGGLAAFFSLDALAQGVKSILSTGNEFTIFEKQLESVFGTAEKGQAAFDWVKTFTKQTPLQLQDVMKSFIMLKNFGVDPTNGSLQAIVDQNAKLGGETERLERITLALGQAFAKTKLQGEEMRQLVEAGVPVYKILGEVTGKSATELQNLGAAGKLGTDILRKFVAQMGKDSIGAAAAQVETLGGQFTVLKDNIQQAEDTVAKSGFADYLRDQLKSLNDLFSQASADGSLKAYAQRVSDGLVSIAKSLKSATLFAIDHAEAIGNVVKAYAAFKIGSIVGELAVGSAKFVEMASSALKTQNAIGGVASKATGLTKILRLLPANVQIALAVVGFEVLKEAGEYIGDLAGKHSDAQKNLDELVKRQQDARVAEARGYQQLAANLGQYSDVQVKSAAEVAELHERQRDYYADQLKGLKEYTEAAYKAEVRLSDAGMASGEELNKARAAMQGAQRASVEFAEGVRVANDALGRGLPVAAAAAQDKLKGIGTDTQSATARLQELFQGFQTSTVTQLGDLALGIAKAGAESQVAGNTIRDSLGGALAQLSSQDLLKFQSAAIAAMDQYKTSAKDAAAVVQPLLEQGLSRLGVAADRWGVASTEAGRSNVAAFQLVTENGLATATAIESAFNKALGNASTIDDAKAIGSAMQVAGQQGKVGFDATERAVANLQTRIRQLKTDVDPLADTFAQLGIQSKKALDDAAAASTAAFNRIVEAQRAGKASIEDVRAAYAAQAKDVQAAAANSDTWKKKNVDAALQTQAAVSGVTTGLDDMGRKADDASSRVEKGAGRARAAFDDSASSSRDAAGATNEVADATDNATESQGHYSKAADESAAADRRHARATESLSFSLGGLSDQLIKDLADLNLYAGTPDIWRTKWNQTMQIATDQLNQFKSQMKSLDAANGEFDEGAKRLAGLRNQYKYLTDDQIGALDQAQQKLADNEKRARDAAKQRDEQANEAGKQRAAGWAQSGATGTPDAPVAGVGPDGRFTIDLNIGNQQRADVPATRLTPTDLQRLVNQLVPVLTTSVVKQLSIRKAAAN